MQSGETRFIRQGPVPGLTLVRTRGRCRPVARHVHATLTLGAILAGRRGIVTADRTIQAEAGMVFAIPPGLAHGVDCAGPCHCVAFSLAPGLLASLLPEGAARFCAAQADCLAANDQILCDDLAGLAQAMEKRESRLQIEEALACILARLAPAEEPVSIRAAAVRVPPWIQTVREHIETRFAEALSLGELAALAGTRPQALVRAFTRELGMPPHALQTQLRVNAAKALLRQGAAIAETAAACGFADQSHLHRHFLRLVGMTPGTYRKG